MIVQTPKIVNGIVADDMLSGVNLYDNGMEFRMSDEDLYCFVYQYETNQSLARDNAIVLLEDKLGWSYDTF